MKILYISSILTIHDYRFLKKLSLNHKVYLVSFKEQAIPDNIKQIEGLTIFHLPIEYFIFKSTDNLAVKMRKAIKNGINFIKRYLYLKYVIKKIKPDIIHAGWVQAAGYIAALSGFHPFVLMPWGCDILNRPHANKKQMNITKYTLNKADRIICDCLEVKNKIIALSGYDENKISIFRWGVDLNLFNPQNRNERIIEKLGWLDKKVVIITRNFEKIYGLDYMAWAIPQVIKDVSEARFIFCGEGEEKQNITDLIKQQNMSDYVYFAGFIEPSYLPHYLNMADIYVSPSLSDGTSISLLEAFACAKAVVVTDVPANLEWVKDADNGYVVRRCDAKALADKIVQLLKDNKLREKMGKKNIAIVKEKANWDKNFEIIEKVYKHLEGVK